MHDLDAYARAFDALRNMSREDVAAMSNQIGKLLAGADTYRARVDGALCKFVGSPVTAAALLVECGGEARHTPLPTYTTRTL